MAPGRGSAAAEAARSEWATFHSTSARTWPRARISEGTRKEPTSRAIQGRALAGRNQRQDAIAVRGRARAPCEQGRSPHKATRRGVAPDRMAQGRTRTDQVLALDASRSDTPHRV